MLSQSYLRELKAFHRALGDVTRLRVVQILATEGEFPVSELVRRLRISAPSLSRTCLRAVIAFWFEL